MLSLSLSLSLSTLTPPPPPPPLHLFLYFAPPPPPPPLPASSLLASLSSSVPTLSIPVQDLHIASKANKCPSLAVELTNQRWLSSPFLCGYFILHTIIHALDKNVLLY